MAEKPTHDNSMCWVSWGDPKEADDGHNNGHYDLVAGKKGKDQQKDRTEEKGKNDEGEKGEEHICVGLQPGDFKAKICEQNSEECNVEEASTASRSRSRKRLPEINTAAVEQDVPLYSAVGELVWDPLTNISTGSFTWEKNILEEGYDGNEMGGEDDDEPEMESCVKTNKEEKAQMGGDESCIDPILLAWVY